MIAFVWFPIATISKLSLLYFINFALLTATNPPILCTSHKIHNYSSQLILDINDTYKSKLTVSFSDKLYIANVVAVSIIVLVIPPCKDLWWLQY
jgi:hypothetical protein